LETELPEDATHDHWKKIQRGHPKSLKTKTKGCKIYTLNKYKVSTAGVVVPDFRTLKTSPASSLLRPCSAMMESMSYDAMAKVTSVRANS
jgi:hypothetical protein